jgi:hypothetical protein
MGLAGTFIAAVSRRGAPGGAVAVGGIGLDVLFWGVDNHPTGGLDSSPTKLA